VGAAKGNSPAHVGHPPATTSISAPGVKGEGMVIAAPPTNGMGRRGGREGGQGALIPVDRFTQAVVLEGEGRTPTRWESHTRNNLQKLGPSWLTMYAC